MEGNLEGNIFSTCPSEVIVVGREILNRVLGSLTDNLPTFVKLSLKHND